VLLLLLSLRGVSEPRREPFSVERKLAHFEFLNDQGPAGSAPSGLFLFAPRRELAENRGTTND
jgi:hypothetical protein